MLGSRKTVGKTIKILPVELEQVAKKVETRSRKKRVNEHVRIEFYLYVTYIVINSINDIQIEVRLLWVRGKNLLVHSE